MEMGESMADPADRYAAAEALADIERQRAFVVRRLEMVWWLHPATAVVLAVAAASLVFRNPVLFVVVQVVYVGALVPLLGTPAKAGVLPREPRPRFGASATVLLFVLLMIPWLAMSGPWWVSIMAGVAAAVIVMTVSRWRRAVARAEARRPTIVERRPETTRVDRVIGAFGRWAGFPLVVALLSAGCVLAYTSGDRALSSLGVPGYMLGLWVLNRVQQRVGVLSEPQRRWVFRRALPLLVVLVLAPLVPELLSQTTNLWVRGACALAAGGGSLIVGCWQYLTLRVTAAPAASEPGPRGG